MCPGRKQRLIMWQRWHSHLETPTVWICASWGFRRLSTGSSFVNHKRVTTLRNNPCCWVRIVSAFRLSDSLFQGHCFLPFFVNGNAARRSPYAYTSHEPRYSPLHARGWIVERHNGREAVNCLSCKTQRLSGERAHPVESQDYRRAWVVIMQG
jgi:hypothetical protein